VALRKRIGPQDLLAVRIILWAALIGVAAFVALVMSLADNPNERNSIAAHQPAAVHR
jgi:hypothetical protein